MRILARSSGCTAAILLAGTAAIAAPAAASAAIQPPPNVPCDSSALVAAIQHANSVGTATLLLANGCNYALSAAVSGDDGLPPITGNLTMTGSGGTTISRSGGANFRLIDVQPGGSLTLTDVAVANGNVATSGGGILAAGNVTLQNVRLSGNTAMSEGGGLFVRSGGRVTVSNSQVSGNHASAAGGGIGDAGSLTLQNVQLTQNVANSKGGGLAVDSQAQATVSSSQFSGNTANGIGGGAIDNQGGQLTVDHSALTGNTAGNSASGGGLNTESGGTSQLSRTVISRNHAARVGGGIANVGTTVLRGDRVVFNRAFTGGGIFNVPGGHVSLRFTIVAFNSPNNCRPRFTIRGCLR